MKPKYHYDELNGLTLDRTHQNKPTPEEQWANLKAWLVVLAFALTFAVGMMVGSWHR